MAKDEASTVTKYVKFLRDTSPYVNAHRGKTFVLAFSGKAMGHANFNNIILDIALLHSLGINLVLVHGAISPINDHSKSSAAQKKLNKHNYVTDSAAMSCIKNAVGSARINIEAMLSTGAVNSPMHGSRIQVASANFITAKPMGIKDGIDFQYTGEIRRIDGNSIKRQLSDGAIALLSPIGYSPTGETFSLNYEDVAAQTAISLGAEKLIMFCQNEGVTSHDGELLKTLSLDEVSEHLSHSDIGYGDRRSLEACSQACENNISRSHIISYTSNGALLEELFTRDGRGTLILKNSSGLIRQATIDDIGGLIELIAPQEKKGVLVKRSRELLELEISRFSIIEHREGAIICCCALYPVDGSRSAEIACVVTHPEFMNQGNASRLLKAVENKASKAEITQLFVLTVQASHWFIEQGFADSSIEELPAKHQSLYNFQRNSKVFCKNL